jgi:hypothetical protein
VCAIVGVGVNWDAEAPKLAGPGLLLTPGLQVSLLIPG